MTTKSKETILFQVICFCSLMAIFFSVFAFENILDHEKFRNILTGNNPIEMHHLPNSPQK